ncbi:hypothetical protein PV10_04141 [Exophiala mesophila]|uniref:Uncharacterized protein n=1 Tax=Exophiala mesophila TaxID=212818 RepID=A0A0D1ZDU1_EXOME|nr:uncharacterized protein PV10_04141 [Exophiala mesophila]KIV92877.1 hypothetical protein PV10_04141 [Exophiala mesophila]
MTSTPASRPRRPSPNLRRSYLLQILDRVCVEGTESISPQRVMESLAAPSRFRWASPDGLEVGIPTDDTTVFVSRARKTQLRQRLLDRHDDYRTEDDKPFPWWLGQCIHYGLNFCFTSTDAKGRLAQALLAEKLKRPRFLKKLGRNLRKTYKNRKKYKSRKRPKRNQQSRSVQKPTEPKDPSCHKRPTPFVVDLTGDDNSSQGTNADALGTQSQRKRDSQTASKENSTRKWLAQIPSIPNHSSKTQRGKHDHLMDTLTPPLSNSESPIDATEHPDLSASEPRDPTPKKHIPSTRRQKPRGESVLDDSIWDIPDSSKHSDQDSDAMTIEEYIPGGDLDFLYKDEEYDRFSEYEASHCSPLANKHHDRLTRSSAEKRKASQLSERDESSHSPHRLPSESPDTEERLTKRIKKHSKKAPSFNRALRAKSHSTDKVKENETHVSNVEANQLKTLKTSLKAFSISSDSDSNSDAEPMSSSATSIIQGQVKPSGSPFRGAVDPKAAAGVSQPLSSGQMPSRHVLPPNSSPTCKVNKDREEQPNVLALSPENSLSRDQSLISAKTAVEDVPVKRYPNATARIKTELARKANVTYPRSTSELLTQVINDTGAIGIALMQASQKPPKLSGSSLLDQDKQAQTQMAPLTSEKQKEHGKRNENIQMPSRSGDASSSKSIPREKGYSASKRKSDLAKQQRKDSTPDRCNAQRKKGLCTSRKSSPKVVRGETSTTPLPGSQLTLSDSAKKYVRDVLVPARAAHWKQKQPQSNQVREPSCTRRGEGLRDCADTAEKSCQKTKMRKERSDVEAPATPRRKSKDQEYRTKLKGDSDKTKKKRGKLEDCREKDSPISRRNSAVSPELATSSASVNH